MKNILVHGLAGIALSFVALGAHAAPVTATVGATTGVKIVEPSYGYLKFSPVGVGMLNACKINGLSASNGASATLGQKTNPASGNISWANVAFNVPLQVLTFDSDSKAMLSDDFVGSFKLVASSSVFTTGGELTLSNLRIDYTTKTVYATTQGGNGVGTRYNVALWTYSSASGDLTYPGGNIQTTVSGLKLTADGLNVWTQSLGYNANGKLAMSAIANDPAGFGTLTITASTTGTPITPPLCPVPAAPALPSPF